jgi:hypothetical protein
MAKKQNAANTPAADGGMATVLVGDAVAIGEDTLTRVDATSSIVERSHKTVAKGVVKAVAVADPAEDGTAYVDAYTDVVSVSGADKARIKTHEKTVEKDGVTYEVSVTKFKAVDRLNKDGETKVIVHQKSDRKSVDHHQTDDDADLLDGNVAIVTFDAQALGEDTLVVVDAYALAVEDQLSQSTVMITSAVG